MCRLANEPFRFMSIEGEDMPEKNEVQHSMLDSMQIFMQDKFVPIAERFARQRHLAALRDGLAVLIPFTIIGGIFCMLVNPPVDPSTMEPSNLFFQFLLAWDSWADVNATLLNIPYNLTLGAISVYAVVGVSYYLSRTYKMDLLPNVLCALFVFLCVAGVPESVADGTYIDLSGLGSGSLFAAIIVALVVIEINHVMIEKNVKITLPEGVPPMVSGPFEVLIPLVVNLLVFMTVDQLLTIVTGSGFASIVYTVFTPLISATSSLPSILVIVALTVIFWFFGIHGDNMVSGIYTPIITNNLIANIAAYSAGEQIPHIIAGNFTFIFGLAIVYLAILFNMNVFCKSARLRSLGRLAIPSSLFNINEPLVFGVPTVLNILTFIPSLVLVLVDVSVAYGATYFGLMSRTCMSVPWTLPGPLYALVSTLDWRSMVVWFLLFIVNVIVFIPFMKAYDSQLLKEEGEAGQ